MRKRSILGSLLGTLVCLLGSSAQALPGSHAPAVSTYDTRASSVVLAYRHGSSDAGPFNTFSYNANFTNTTGKLSAQFGIHYVNFASKQNDSTAHGIGASGVAVFVFPVAGRYDNGLPKAAISFDVGAVPTVYVSSQRNYLTLPLVLGVGMPLSPHPALTLTPWFELAPSANLDTVFRAADVTLGPDDIKVTPNPATGTVDVSLNQGAVQAAVKKGVTIDYGFSVPMRAGLEAALHVSESVDLNVYGAGSTLGGGFSGAAVFSLGAGLVFRWDDIVPAVLPVERRLEHESCAAIEGRFRSCPNSRQWLTPEQRARLSEPVTNVPPANATSRPASTAIAPAATPARPPPALPASPATRSGPKVPPATPASTAPSSASPASTPGAPASAAFPD